MSLEDINALNLKIDNAITQFSVRSKTISGNYTPNLGDAGFVIECNNGSAMTFTLPSHTSVPFPIGTIIHVYTMTTAAVTITGSGATIRNSGIIADRYIQVAIRKRDLNEWVVIGSMI
jgi:hypothetical protein